MEKMAHLGVDNYLMEWVKGFLFDNLFSVFEVVFSLPMMGQIMSL